MGTQQHHSSLLPPHAQVVADPDVWMEGTAIEQLARVASTPGCRCAVGMPDLHPGRGIPIGAVFAFADRVLPLLVGGDAGCGVRLQVISAKKARHTGDALERRVREATDGPALPDVDPVEALAATWRNGVAALAGLSGVPESLRALAEEASSTAEGARDLVESGPPPIDAVMGRQLGTAGGGNHFIEVSTVSKVHDKARAKQAGLHRGAQVVLAHSGSRGAGGALARQWAAAQLSSDAPVELATYLAALAGATRFARANRFVLVWRLLTALGAARSSRLGLSLDLTHNTVEHGEYRGEPVYIHRKGAAPARRDELTVVLGSRGTPSVVMEGLGSQAHLSSVAHGAGRRMGRSEALDKLRARYTRKTVRSGGVVVCDDARLLFEEHPDAYKPVAPVVRSLERAGMARAVVELTPIITVKR